MKSLSVNVLIFVFLRCFHWNMAPINTPITPGKPFFASDWFMISSSFSSFGHFMNVSLLFSIRATDKRLVIQNVVDVSMSNLSAISSYG